MSYVAFISYRHSFLSRPHAEQLEAALKRYAKPLWKPPIAIFRDERVLRPGDDLPVVIRRALEQSQYLLYLANREATNSPWIEEELRIWCGDLNRAERLLLVHIGDRITSDSTTGRIVWEESDALPHVLKPYLGSIPIWADLTWATTAEHRDLNNVEYKKQVNAIIAKFRGKTPGEMNDEQVLTHRRNIRLRNIGIGLVAAFALLATFFGDQARRDRNAAERSAAAALASEKRALKSAAAAIKSQEEAEASAEEARTQRKVADEQREAAEQATDVAEEQRGIAEQRASIALSRQLAAQANSLRRDQLDTAMLLAVEAHAVSPTPEARDALVTVLTDRQHFAGYIRSEPGISRVAFAQGSGLLAAANNDGTISLFGVDSYKVKHIISSTSSSARGLIVAPDGQWVAAVDDDDDVLRVWRVGVRTNPRAIKVGFSGFFGLDLAHGSAGFASAPCPIAATADGRGILFVAPSLRLAFQRVGGVDAPIEFYAGQDMNEDRRYAAVGSSSSGTLVGAIGGHSVYIWDIAQPSAPLHILSPSPATRLRDFVFLPSGGIGALTEDGHVVIWPRLEEATPIRFRAHAVSGEHIAVSPDGNWLATAGAERGYEIAEESATAKIWSFRSVAPWQELKPTMTFPLSGNHPFSLSFSTDGTQLATTTERNFVELWDLERVHPMVTRLRRPDGALATGTMITPTTDHSRLMVVDLSAGILLLDASGATRTVMPIMLSPESPDERIDGVAALSDRLFAFRTPRAITIWDMVQRKAVALLKPVDSEETLRGPITASRDVVVSGAGVDASFWRLSDSTVARRLESPNGWAYVSLAISPDGNQLFAGSTYRGVVSAWGLAGAAQPLTKLFTHDVEVTDMVVSENGLHLYTAHPNGDVLRTTLRGDRSTQVFLSRAAGKSPRLALSRDGSLLAVGNEDGDISLWSTVSQARNGQPFRYPGISTVPLSLLDSNASVKQMVFLHGKDQLVALYEDGLVAVWDLRIDQWVGQARQLAGRSLSEAERIRFLATAPAIVAAVPNAERTKPSAVKPSGAAAGQCFQGFIEKEFKPLDCSEELRSLVELIIENRPDDAKICSAYARVLAWKPIFMSGLQSAWAKTEISNRTIFTPAAIAVLGLTGDAGDADFLRDAPARLAASKSETSLWQWADRFLAKNGRDTSLGALRSVSDPTIVPYQRYLAWPVCVDTLISWQAIDPAGQGKSWPELEVAKFETTDSMAAVAYNFLVSGKERYTLLSVIGELLADKKALEARTYAEAAIRLAPSNARIRNVAGIVEDRLGNQDRAEGHYTASAVMAPRDGWPVFNLANIAVRKGRFTIAERHFEEALSRSLAADGHNDRAAFLNGYAWYLYTQRRSDPEALRKGFVMATEANTLRQYQNYSHIDTLAAILYAQGDIVEAVDMERKAVWLMKQRRIEDAEISGRLMEFEQRLRSGVSLPREEQLSTDDARHLDLDLAERICSDNLRVFDAIPGGLYRWISGDRDEFENFERYMSLKKACSSALPRERLRSLLRMNWQVTGTNTACSCKAR